MNRTTPDTLGQAALLVALPLALAFGIGASLWQRDNLRELTDLRARVARLDRLHERDEQLDRWSREAVEQGRKDLAGAEREVRR